MTSLDNPSSKDTLEITFKRNDWFEVFDCASQKWAVRRLDDGAVGRKSSHRTFKKTRILTQCETSSHTGALRQSIFERCGKGCRHSDI
jgi:hypothetical protein